jgi:hypothetical protein
MNVDAKKVINSLLGQISVLSQEKAMLIAQLEALAPEEQEQEEVTESDESV